MGTRLYKRATNGFNNFHIMTDDGRTIKDFEHSELKKLLKGAGFHGPAINKIQDKSLLWKMCIDNNLL